MCKLWLGGPFKSLVHTESMNNPAFGHIVCQPIRNLQVGSDLPDRPHVSVKGEEGRTYFGRREELNCAKTTCRSPFIQKISV